MSKKEKDSEYKKLSSLWLYLGLPIVIVLCFFAVWLFTQPACIEAYNLSGKGDIGVTINGIVSPIIALFGAVLVYLSFKVQFEANQRQLSEIRKEKLVRIQDKTFDVCYEIYQTILEDVQNFNIVVDYEIEEGEYIRSLKREYKGYEAIWEFMNILNKNNLKDSRIQLEYLSYILHKILILRYKIETTSMNPSDRHFLKEDCLMSILNLYFEPFRKIHVKIFKAKPDNFALKGTLKRYTNNFNNIKYYYRAQIRMKRRKS